MKKIEGLSKYESFYGKKIYLNNLKNIFNIIKENNYSIKISNKEYFYESIEEVIEHLGYSPDYLDIVGGLVINPKYFNNKINISFERGRIFVHVNNDSDGDVLKYDKIIKLLESIKSSKIRFGRNKSSLVLKNKDDEIFWKKYKDKIILTFFGAIVGSLLTFLLPILFKLIFKK